MKVLVTGGAGFLGTNIVLHCLSKGWKVRVLDLPNANTKYIQKPDVEIMFGDIADATSVRKAVEGVDVVIHVAGDTSFWKKRFERQRRTNVDGVRNVMQS